MTAASSGGALRTRMTNDVLAGTIAEMTWIEVAQAAQRGAILLWAFGVIEQHGPHLPTGTDVYLPSARLREVRAALAERGIEALIVPPYYWGVNEVSSGFPASYRVRPELMVEIMSDVFASVKDDGFVHVFCVSGHGDAAHNQTIVRGARVGRERTGLDISFAIDEVQAARLGLDPTDSALTTHRSIRKTGLKFLDVHAGESETSRMMCICAGLVRDDVRASLASTELGPDDLATWRKGAEHARCKTPLGYFGDPAAASEEAGRVALADSVNYLVEAIESRVAKGAA